MKYFLGISLLLIMAICQFSQPVAASIFSRRSKQENIAVKDRPQQQSQVTQQESSAVPSKTFIALNWSRHQQSQRQEPHFTLEIGQSFLDQIFHVKMIHLLADTMINTPLALNATKYGTLTISNLRVKKMRLLDFKDNRHVRVTQNQDGTEDLVPGRGSISSMFLHKRGLRDRFRSTLGSMTGSVSPSPVSSDASDSSSSEDSYSSGDSILQANGVANPSIKVALLQDSIKVIIKGINTVFAADYHEKLGGGRGTVFLRSVNGAVAFELVGSVHKQTGHPTMMFKTKPKIYLGKLSMKLDGNHNLRNSIISKFSSPIIDHVSKVAAKFAETGIQKSVPDIINNVIVDSKKQILIGSTNFLEGMGFSAPDNPYLSIDDFKWIVRDKKLLITSRFTYSGEHFMNQPQSMRTSSI